jgi:hypothetical protein
MALCPTIYTTIRTFYLGQLPGEWSYSIAGQLSWVNLIYEVINEAIILPLFYFVGQVTSDEEAQKIISLGFNGVNIVRKDDFFKLKRYSNVFMRYYNKFLRLLGKAPYHYDYEKIWKFFVQSNGIEKENGFSPTLIPNWDHFPRRGKRACIFFNSTPGNFEKHVNSVVSMCKKKGMRDDNLVFLKSWNEWGEGNYVELCERYGMGYIDVIKKYFDCRM